MDVNSYNGDHSADDWARTQYERLRQISIEDALDGIPPFPRLPANLDDSVALDNWVTAWNVWVMNEAVQRQRPWVKPMTPQVLASVVKAERRLRADLTETERQREVAAAREAVNALEVRLQSSDPQWGAKRALLVPILKPAFAYLPPSKWASVLEQSYAGVRLSGPMGPVALAPRMQASERGGKQYREEVATVFLYQLSRYPGRIAISKTDPPVEGGAFFLDFSRRLILYRQIFGVNNRYVGKIVGLGVPVVHEGENNGGFLVYMYRIDPRFLEVLAMWKARYPQERVAVQAVVGSLKILADFGGQFPPDATPPNS